jgi:integrase
VPSPKSQTNCLSGNTLLIRGHFYPRGRDTPECRTGLDQDVSSADEIGVAPVIAGESNVPALPYAKVGAFMARLRKEPSTRARALEFTILCASRLGEVLGARWGEIDLKARLWTIPAERMKMREEHNVALSEAACAILQAIKGDTTPHPSTLVFTNRVCKTDLLKLARRLQPDMPEVTVHGFRSCFRDWVSDETDHAREVAEHALAHKVKGVEGDYRRGTALKKRRIMMDDWAKFCAAAPADSAIDQVA